MKFLTLVRHSEASMYAASDFARKLTEDGRRIAFRNSSLLRAAMAGAGTSPDCLISSSAVRAVETARIFAEAFDPPPAVVSDPGLYSCPGGEILRTAAQLDDSFSNLVLVGHNPSVFEAVSVLVPDMPYSFPVCSLCFFSFSVGSWSCIPAARAALIFTTVGLRME